MTWHSAIYDGWVRHRRFGTTPNEFRYALFMMYLDLDEIPELFRGHLLWGLERPAVGSFYRRDYLGDPRQPLRDAVADVVESRLGRRPNGAIRLLTHLRTFGYAFNPIRVYYCFEGPRLDALVLEVTNTPWGQRHCYVLDARAAQGEQPGRSLRFIERKAFHVSPFLPMDLTYRFAIAPPAEDLTFHMDCLAPAGKSLDATLRLRRQTWNRSNLTRVLVRYPWITGKVVAAIYWQALKLWCKRLPYFPNPHETIPDELPQSGHQRHRPAASASLARNLGARAHAEEAVPAARR